MWFFGKIKELEYLAYHDLLTGLFNRNYIYKKLKHNKYKYIYFIDIKDLRKFNEMGHTIGDLQITKCVDEINSIITKDCVFCRYAGDEFLLFSNVKDILKSNDLYHIGMSEIVKSLYESINNADKDMLCKK